MGGGELYAQAMSLAHELAVTEIDAAFEGDTFAPSVESAVWTLNHRECQVAANGLAFSWNQWLKR